MQQRTKDKLRFGFYFVFVVSYFRFTNTSVSRLSSKDVATNPRGIPQAPFVDKVEDYVTSREDVEPTLRRFQEMISKYQFMEQNLQRRVAGLDEKLPDIQKTLDTVRFLQTRRPGGAKRACADEDDDKDSLDSDEDEDEGETDEGEAIETTFELNDTLYAKATIPPTDEVHLWLGVCAAIAGGWKHLLGRRRRS